MGRVRGRLLKLEETAKRETMTLLCPECGAEFVAYGDVPLEFVVHQWATQTGQEGHHETPEDILRISAHEHDPGAFLEKGSGLPFLSKAVSGIDIGASPGDAGAGDDGGA
ncbi:MAG TPA: hypothetical protein VGR18_00925 [Rubrobacter sp.]|nr:hypothetical protein [Rubrobacter sp.]